MRKVTTFFIYSSIFITIVFLMCIVSLVLILFNEMFLHFVAIVVVFWLTTAFLTIKTLEKEKERANDTRRRY